MINTKQIKEEVNKLYDLNIADQSRREVNVTAKKVFVAVCRHLNISEEAIASELQLARISLYNECYAHIKISKRDKFNVNKIIKAVQDKDYFTILDGYKISGKPLNSLMFELAHWDDDILVEFIENNVKQFKRENFIE